MYNLYLYAIFSKIYSRHIESCIIRFLFFVHVHYCFYFVMIAFIHPSLIHSMYNY